MLDAARALVDFTRRDGRVFVRTEPWVLDPSQDARLHVHGLNDAHHVMPLSDAPMAASLLANSVFGEGRQVIAWDWKSLATYFQSRLGRPYAPQAAVIDLKVIEAYCGVKGKAPDALAYALNRVKSTISSGGWPEAQNAYKSVLLPLLSKTLPALEVTPLVDRRLGRQVFAHYEVLGQENGRLRCSKAFRYGFVPHAMSEADRESLVPRDLGEFFVYFDYVGMEVSVLAWLSGDVRLGEMAARPDVYLELDAALTGSAGDRDRAKKIFLPVIYGQSAAALAAALKVSTATAAELVRRVHALFPAALRWVESHQERAKAGLVRDVFGKARCFGEGEEYLARNFSVQSPASLICLDRLNELQKSFAVVFHVHDGYCVYATKGDYRTVAAEGARILRESPLGPGLRLRVACQAGFRLNKLKPLKLGDQ